MNWRDKYKKAVTFSYDDGIRSDLKLLELFDRYGVKATFNVNTGKSSDPAFDWQYKDFTVHHLDLEQYVEAYKGHEIAVHTLTHPNLTEISEQQVRFQIVGDRNNIRKLFGETPMGAAYPYGAYDDTAVKELQNAGIRYCRGVESSYNFDEQEDLLIFKPTCHHSDAALFDLAEKFLKMEPEKPQIFYIWGHSYEFDGNQDWDRMEAFLKLISGHEDIFYGTNKEVLL